MLLSCRILKDVANVNSFEYDLAAKITAGDTVSLYIQLIDASVHTREDGFYPSGRRYMPVVGATLQVTFDNINDAKKVTKFASQPFAQDPSIWKIDVLSTDPIKGTVNIRLSLTESGVVTRGTLQAGLLAYPQTGLG